MKLKAAVEKVYYFVVRFVVDIMFVKGEQKKGREREREGEREVFRDHNLCLTLNLKKHWVTAVPKRCLSCV